MNERTRSTIAAATCVLTLGIHAGAAPDGSIDGQSAELVLLSQTRTLDATAGCPDPWYPCEDSDHDGSSGFGSYSGTVIADCGSGKGMASQRSTVEPGVISAAGWAYGKGCDGGGCYCGGSGQSVFEVTFESPSSCWITISGEFTTDGNPDGTYGSRSATMTLTDSAGTTLLEEELSVVQGSLNFASPFLLQPGEAYTLHVQGAASDGDFHSYADYAVVLSPHSPADVNGDDIVDTLDLLAVLAAWGGGGVPEDINGDGVVSVLDILELLAQWGVGGPPVGACCLPGGLCEDLPQLDCILGDGAWLPGEECATAACSPVYCPAGDGCGPAQIHRVAIGAIDNASDCGSYQDFTDLTAEVYKMVPADIVVETWDWGFATAWVDWNQDGDFEDAGEAYPLGYNGGSPIATGTIIAPPNAYGGLTRMRVRISGYEPPAPCGIGYWDGEVEDYTINVLSAEE